MNNRFSVLSAVALFGLSFSSYAGEPVMPEVGDTPVAEDVHHPFDDSDNNFFSSFDNIMHQMERRMHSMRKEMKKNIRAASSGIVADKKALQTVLREDEKQVIVEIAGYQKTASEVQARIDGGKLLVAAPSEHGSLRVTVHPRFVTIATTYEVRQGSASDEGNAQEMMVQSGSATESHSIAEVDLEGVVINVAKKDHKLIIMLPKKASKKIAVHNV